MEFLSSVLGHICYVAVIFSAGALIGRPLYTWVSAKMPWSSK